VARGEVPRGFKIGFTNRSIWQRYNVSAPIWGTVWDHTLTFCERHAKISLAKTSLPRLEPEVVFGMKSTPKPDATMDDLFNAIDWVAAGIEVVQSHAKDWQFTPPDAVADGSLHARLLVGRKQPVKSLADSAAQLNERLAKATVSLNNDDEVVDEGSGANVLDGPLKALHEFLGELRQCPGAPDLAPGDVVTTGTWTDAWSVEPGEQWIAEFSAPLSRLSVEFR
jgi:2-oxo-3-hexenedioate decarboxylase